MLALVTCHIFHPLNLIRKKMNSWHLTSRLTARSFSVSTASRVRSGRCPRQCATLLHGQMYLQEKTPVLQFGHTLEQNSSICPIISYLWMVDLVMRFFSCGASLWRSSTRIRPKKGPAPWILFLTPAPRPLQVTFFWLVKLNICGCTLLQSHVKNHTPSINHGTCFSWGLTFRYVLVNSHLIHPPSNSWLLTLGILQTYTLSESFMIDFLMPYIHKLIDQPPLNHNRQKLISCHCTSGSFQEKNLGFFGMIFYSWPHIMPRDPHPLSARFLENSVF